MNKKAILSRLKIVELFKGFGGLKADITNRRNFKYFKNTVRMGYFFFNIFKQFIVALDTTNDTFKKKYFLF